MDGAAAKAVRQIVRLDDAVAVVADHMGATRKGLAALVIEWDDGPHDKLNTQDIVDELEKATLNSGPGAQHIGNSDESMASAVTKVEATYQVPFLAHSTMEPMNCTVHFRKDGCEVWSAPGKCFDTQLRRRPLCGLRGGRHGHDNPSGQHPPRDTA
jgi:isoquinoline 1-oxidoreductase subunit beta